MKPLVNKLKTTSIAGFFKSRNRRKPKGVPMVFEPATGRIWKFLGEWTQVAGAK